MTRTIADAEIALYQPEASTPYVTIPNEDIRSLEITERVQDAMDSGQITIENQGGAYSTDYDITTGDRLEFRVQLAEQSSLQDRWTAIVRDPADVLEGATRQRLDLEATDFVFTVLSWRLAYETFESAPVSGSADAIVDTLVANEAPEIDRSGIQAVDVDTDGFYNGRDLLSIVTQDLAPIGNALVAQDGTTLVFKPLSGLTPQFALTPSDFRGEVKIATADSEMANLVRVDGGTDHDSDAEQTTHDGSTRVTDSSRLTTQIETRKSEVDRIQVYTQADGTSADGLTVRLQADRNGSPVAIDDPSSDIVRKTLASDFLAADGWTTFIMPAHTLSPQSYPWLIIEADGADGHDVGTDSSSGEPAYKAMYPFPLLTRIPDTGSQREFRRRDHRIKDDSLDSFAAVQDKARSYLKHHTEPRRTLSGDAESLDAHDLSPGDAVDLYGWDSVGLSGTWLCRERTTTYDGSTNRLSTSLSLQEVATL